MRSNQRQMDRVPRVQEKMDMQEALNVQFEPSSESEQLHRKREKGLVSQLEPWNWNQEYEKGREQIGLLANWGKEKQKKGKKN